MKHLNVIPYPNSVKITGQEIPAGNIDISASSLTITEEIANPEAYELEIADSSVTIKAGDAKGAFYAKQTLKQLAAAGNGVLPSAVIKDEPAFPYRGFMLDSARHMTALDDVKKLIDAAALMKMNVMHWHLTDDQGWRVEIESRPELMKTGSRRPASNFGKIHNNREYGGYYTKNELREIVDYCGKRHIELIPEIDMPGHMIAAIASYPELSCRGGRMEVETRQGIFPDILCAGKESTFDFVFDVLDEILAVFPSEYVHIGGDEAPKKRWQECPHCQKKAAELGLSNMEELQGWFVNRIGRFLADNGRTAIAWNESLKSGALDRNTAVQMWMDKKGLSEDFANAGGKIIVSPFYHYYTDYPYGMTPLNKTYRFNPVLKGINPESAGNVLGVEAPIWTEHVRDFGRMCYMAYPRFAAVAETGWTRAEHKDAESFARRMKVFAQQLEEIGITPAMPQAWNPGPFERLRQTIKFFSGTLTKDMVKGYK